MYIIGRNSHFYRHTEIQVNQFPNKFPNQQLLPQQLLPSLSTTFPTNCPIQPFLLPFLQALLNPCTSGIISLGTLYQLLLLLATGICSVHSKYTAFIVRYFSLRKNSEEKRQTSLYPMGTLWKNIPLSFLFNHV